MTDNLRTRIVSTAISNLCLLSGRHGKTVDHLSFIVIIDNLSFIVIIPMFCGTAWKLIPFAILWLVWKERTSRIIRGASMSMDDVCICDYKNSHLALFKKQI
eukprot:TRINITY_DN32927_c3_g1_i1.p2 TRINITY_DN32927_c3_g1~~TRINITY_DN32927_c3_g1_i1.p2  ORF type:complete len:102 (+),score=13.16 TRINITY_DN32927_c3_g1_i1:1293-1598(+)